MRLSAVASVAGLVLAMAAPASAATFTVSGTGDGAGSCTGSVCTTIRAALTEAAKTPDTPDTVSLDAKTYTVSAPLTLAGTVTLSGAGSATSRIAVSGKVRVFTVTGHATITGVRTSGGDISAVAADPDGGVGVVAAGASLTLDHGWVDGGKAAHGGGLVNHGTLTVTKSLVANDSATVEGGGIYNAGTTMAPATLTLSDSTVALDKAPAQAGVESVGGAANAVTVTRTTIAANTATTGNGGLSSDAAGTLHVGGSLITGGCDGAAPVSDGGNVEAGSTCGFTQPADKPGAGAAVVATTLIAVGTGASASQALAIPAASAAVDAAGACTGADQRDAPRPQGTACDAGAYELPAARIDDKPASPTNNTTPTFAFSTTAPGAKFQCSLRTTGTSFASCTSPFTAAAQIDGVYTFAVRAIDGANPGLPATYTFTIDTPPTTAIQTGPSGPTNATVATFTYNANELNSTFTCALSGPGQTGAMGACNVAGRTYSGLAEGDYTFSVDAIDPGGTHDPTPATRSFTVDTTPPAVTVTGGPGETTQDTAVAFAFSSEPGATFQCRIDAATFKPCTSPAAYDVTAAGAHTFTVRATDTAGNSSAAASRTYTLVVPAAATPAPAPAVTPAPPPVVAASPPATGLLVTPVRGTTLVQAPGQDAFEPLDGATRIASGSLVDVRTSRVRLADGTVVSGGVFRLTATALQLVERLKPCAGATRRLSIDGTAVVRGQFATVTGTRARWVVQDSCTSTTTRVTSGTATVRDLVRRKTVRVRARHAYTARKSR